MTGRSFMAHAWSNRLRAALKVAGPLALPAAGIAVLYCLQDRLVFNPARTPSTGKPVAPSHRKRAVVLPMRDGTRLRGWWYRPQRDCAAPAAGVIYFGGRNEEVSWVSGVVSYFEGVHLLAVNYRGYGASEGRASELALSADALELCDWLKSRPGVNPARVAVVGRSLELLAPLLLRSARRQRYRTPSQTPQATGCLQGWRSRLRDRAHAKSIRRPASAATPRAVGRCRAVQQPMQEDC